MTFNSADERCRRIDEHHPRFRSKEAMDCKPHVGRDDKHKLRVIHNMQIGMVELGRSAA